MAHNVEPMDIDIDSDFDNKENSIMNSNVYTKTHCTEKGYEELDVSELNMKLRYSVTPVSSPMSKSYTANCVDNNTFVLNDDASNGNLTRSYNSTLSNNDVIKSSKPFPLQSLSADQMESSRTSHSRSLDPIKLPKEAKVTVEITSLNENEDNFDNPSSSSSLAVTPDGTPAKEVLRSEGGSPIMRGLKSVLNMFRSSQSPIPPSETENSLPKQILSPADVTPCDSSTQPAQAVLASTPIASHKIKESTRRNSPLKESIIFNDDLEKELLWKDETTILFSEEKIPIHKLFYPQPLNNVTESVKPTNEESSTKTNLNVTVEYMDISCNNSIVKDHTLTDIQSEEQQVIGESDGEFVDCETTFTNDKSDILNDNVNETESSSAVHSTPSTHNNQTHTIESLQQNQLDSASNTEINLSATNPQKGDFNASQPTTTLDEKILKTDIPQEIANKHETQNNIPVTDESHILRDAMCDSSPKSSQNLQKIGDSSQADINKDNLYVHEIKIVELKSESEYTAIASEEPITNHIAISAPSIVTAVEKDEISNSVNTTMKPEEIIQQSSHKENLNATLETLYSCAQSAVTDTKIALNQTNILEMFSDNDISKNNQSDINECNQASNGLSLHVSEHNKESSFAADIPLPEDNFEFEVQSNVDDLTFALNNEIVYPELESIPHVDTVPSNSMALAKQDDNKVICGDIDGKLACFINMQVEGGEKKITFVSTDESINVGTNNEKITKTSQDFIIEKTTIKNELSDNEEIVKNQFNKLEIESNYEEFKIDNNAQSELNPLEVEYIDKPLESHNMDNVKLYVEDKTLKSETPCEESSERTIDYKVCPEDQENKMAHTDVIPDKVTPTLLLNSSNIIRCDKTELKPNELIKNNETLCCVSDHFEKINCEVKTETLPDVISNIIVSNVPDERPVQNNKDSVDENHDNGIKKIISEMVNSETMSPKIEAIEDNIDDEIILSENNSPFVSIAGEVNYSDDKLLKLEEKEDFFDNKTEVASSPPISPKISSKGYNFNFDEIDDPFATKTKIRLSPPPNSPGGVKVKSDETISINDNTTNTHIENNQYAQNFRTSTDIVEPPKIEKHNEKKCDSIPELVASSTSQHIFCESSNEDILIKSEKIADLNVQQSSKSRSESLIENENKDNNKRDSLLNVEYNKDVEVLSIEKNVLVDSLTSSNDTKQTSSSEQSAYYSANTSGDNNKNRNVFNIPEIDDTNPFLTKSKICESPQPSKNESFSSICSNPSQECNANNKTFEDKDSSNISNTTCSSKTTEERDITVREVHTEDEDTIEGPFLEDDDLNNVDKISDFDSEDMNMMQFSELPVQANEEQPEGEEMFIDAEAFEFLLNQNKTNVVTDSGKESLFLKFDPLFAKRVSTDGVLAALNNVQKRQSTPRKVSVAQQLDVTFEKPVAGPSNLNVIQKTNNIYDSVGDNIEDLNVTVSKPMMVVTPAVNPVVTPRNKSLTPTSSNRRSLTFSSPAIAVIDRLLSLSGNNSFLGHDSTIIQANREQNEAELALSQLRELLAEKEVQVYNLRSESKDLKNRLSTLESQMRTLESDSEVRLKKINDLNDKLSEKTKLNKSMAAVVEEYERTIASLIAESEQDKKRHNEERTKLVEERDEQTAHLASMEVSFNDLHSKYEKSKQVILTCKANEDAYKKSIKQFEENLSKMQSNYELLKQHATSKLNHANQELEKMNRAHEADVLKLNAMIKRKELHITSLEETLAQKTKANEELTAICDELINKVG